MGGLACPGIRGAWLIGKVCVCVAVSVLSPKYRFYSGTRNRNHNRNWDRDLYIKKNKKWTPYVLISRERFAAFCIRFLSWVKPWKGSPSTPIPPLLPHRLKGLYTGKQREGGGGGGRGKQREGGGGGELDGQADDDDTRKLLKLRHAMPLWLYHQNYIYGMKGQTAI